MVLTEIIIRLLVFGVKKTSFVLDALEELGVFPRFHPEFRGGPCFSNQICVERQRAIVVIKRTVDPWIVLIEHPSVHCLQARLVVDFYFYI